MSKVKNNKVLQLGVFWVLFFSSVSFTHVWAADVPPSKKIELKNVEPFCSDKIDSTWRKAQTIEGVEIAESRVCSPDNPYAIASFVKGTNNVSMGTIMATRLSPDAVIKGKDLDGDGDPDEIEIRLEVAELNGYTPDSKELINQFPIAPGITPSFWVFAPKTRGMSSTNFESLEANRLLRAPSPAIRVEQGDTVKLVLENTHYMPHTIHLHGVDHPFLDENGEGNDGVPQASEGLVMPGQSRTYNMKPRQTGTMAYHCHVQTDKHVLMGLIGMFIVEENKPNNWVQTFNVGAGHVRHSSVGIKEEFDREYDLQYIEMDKELHALVQQSNDPRLLAKQMNRVYNMTERVPEYFLLNGRSWPYTLRESLVIVKPDENIKMRVFNSGDMLMSLHTHGHKATITHYDGVEHNLLAQITRDVYMLGAAQRVDLKLNTTDDGLHSYGEGIWVFHDHNEIRVTTDGMHPGGDISAIVYESFLGENGMPKGRGVNLSQFFTEAFYKKEIPVWTHSDPDGFFGEIDIKGSQSSNSTMNMILVILSVLAFLGLIVFLERRTKRN